MRQSSRLLLPGSWTGRRSECHWDRRLGSGSGTGMPRLVVLLIGGPIPRLQSRHSSGRCSRMPCSGIRIHCGRYCSSCSISSSARSSRYELNRVRTSSGGDGRKSTPDGRLEVLLQEDAAGPAVPGAGPFFDCGMTFAAGNDSRNIAEQCSMRNVVQGAQHAGDVAQC